MESWVILSLVIAGVLLAGGVIWAVRIAGGGRWAQIGAAVGVATLAVAVWSVLRF